MSFIRRYSPLAPAKILTRLLLTIVPSQVRREPSVALATIPLLLCFLVATGTAFGQQTESWKGGTGTWSNANNWLGGVPTTSSLVLITNGNAASSTVTLDVNASVLSLALGEGDTLALQGFPSPQTLTAGSVSLDGTTDIGGGATLAIQGFSGNSGTIRLSTTIINPELAPLQGEITGAGTLDNALGLIIGAGTVTTDIQNTGLIQAQGGTLTLMGNVTNSGNGSVSASVGAALTLDSAHVAGGVLFGQVSALNGATVGDMTFSNPVTLTSGSTLGLQGTVNNVAGLTLNGGSTLDVQGTLISQQAGLGINLGSGGQGATISGGGTIVVHGGIGGVGTISANIQNGTSSGNFGTIAAGAGQLVLQGNIDNTFGNIFASEQSGILVLDGAHVTGGIFSGGILSAINGATMKDVFIATDTNSMRILYGSTLGIEGTVTNGEIPSLGQTITLGIPGQASVTLNGGGTLVNNGVIQGAGTLDVAVVNNGFLVALYPGEALVLGGNVTGTGSVVANYDGAIVTLDHVTVQNNVTVQFAHSELNGNGTIVSNVFSNGIVSPGNGAPGLIGIVGNYTQTSTGTLDILLGGAGAGEFGQLDISGLASLDGTLDVQLFGGFDPSAGDVFEILKAGSIDDDLANLIFPELDKGLLFQLEQNPNGIFLDVLGGSGNGGNGGSGGGNGGGATATTPEPGSLLLLGLGLFGMFAVRLGLSRKKRILAAV